jgi:hypothetical protein
MSCSGSHLGIPINIKNTKFVKDPPMIDIQFRFNQCRHSFYLGPIDSFYNQVNDTYRLLRASGVFMFSLEVSTECFSLCWLLNFIPYFCQKIPKKDLPMIDAQFRFIQCNSFRKENISVLILWPVVVAILDFRSSQKTQT